MRCVLLLFKAEQNDLNEQRVQFWHFIEDILQVKVWDKSFAQNDSDILIESGCEQNIL